MKQLIKSALVAALAASAALPTVAMAQAAGPVIIVDMERVGAESAAGKSGQAQLQTKLTALQQRAQTLGQQFQKEEQDLIKAKQTNAVAPAAFDAKVKDLQARQGTAQKEIDGRRDDFQRSQNWIRQQIFQAVSPIVQTLMKEKNAQLVLTRDAAMAFAPQLDVTGEVITRLNKSLPSVNANPPAAPAGKQD